MTTVPVPIDAPCILITGGSSGLGRATARALAGLGARIVIVGRDLPRTRAAVEWIKRESGNPRVDLLLADLAHPQEVRDLALAFRRGFGRLDVLINNAGAFYSDLHIGPGGFERTWALNHLARVGLTVELLPLLRAGGAGRIVDVSSSWHRHGWIDFDDLAGIPRARGLRAYAQAELANLLFTQALARRLTGTGVTVNSLHPGMIESGFGRQMNGAARIAWLLARPIRRSPARAAATSVYLASAPAVQGLTGGYFVDCRAISPGRAALDVELQERLWRFSLAQLGLVDDVVGPVDPPGGLIAAGSGGRS
jgi:retinol dehydrogenase-12